MAPIVKDVENSAATTAPAAPATKPPQPVALEVPVTVNGARTVDGSDKREPFSESTKTVLIFGHGAVIRLTSLVAPGQLLFVTNEKTKKEVVCQVVKSKNYRTVTGYVELEFTEPAVGFWGMRFPPDRVSPAQATSTGPVAPIAHVPAQHPVASAPSAVASSAKGGGRSGDVGRPGAIDAGCSGGGGISSPGNSESGLHVSIPSCQPRSVGTNCP